MFWLIWFLMVEFGMFYCCVLYLFYWVNGKMVIIIFYFCWYFRLKNKGVFCFFVLLYFLRWILMICFLFSFVNVIWFWRVLIVGLIRWMIWLVFVCVFGIVKWFFVKFFLIIIVLFFRFMFFYLSVYSLSGWMLV